MKKTVLFCAVLLVLATSCIKDYQGGGQDEEIEFTEKNYIYEGDLYRIALETQIEALDVLIQELEDIIAINQGTEDTETQLENALMQRNMLTEEIKSIFSLDLVGLRIPPPPPPCPVPRNCDFSGLEYILTDSLTERLELRFLNKDGNLIGGGVINDLKSLPGSENQLNFSSLVLSNTSETVFSIQVKVLKTDKRELNYTVN